MEEKKLVVVVFFRLMQFLWERKLIMKKVYIKKKFVKEKKVQQESKLFLQQKDDFLIVRFFRDFYFREFQLQLRQNVERRRRRRRQQQVVVVVGGW